MYCAGCGTQIQSGLNYCNRCGRRVAEDSKKSSRTNPLVVAGNVAGFGFVGFIFVLVVLTRSGALPNIYVPLTLVYFSALFGICFMILKMGSGSSESLPSANPTTDAAPNYLRPVTTNQLEEARDMGIGSVTDATTRTLDEVKIERN